MNEVCTNWLSDRWEGVIEGSILKLNQGDCPFWDWLQSLQATNTLIIGTYAKLDDAMIQTHIKSNLNETLKTQVNHKKTHTELDFKKWTIALKLLNNDRINKEHKLLEMITKQHASCLETCCDFMCPLSNPSHAANTPSFNCNTPKPSMSATPAAFV
jgi:hypothetical protein